MNNELQKLADILGYKLIYNHESNADPVFNDCYISGNNIWIGDYDNEECKLISFFHEHGNTLVSESFKEKLDFNTLLIELEAWHLGIACAMDMGYFFSDDAIQFGYQKALTYVGHDERECSDWKNKQQKLWIWQNRTDYSSGLSDLLNNRFDDYIEKIRIAGINFIRRMK
jgi:hypothetical protein